MVPTFGLDLGNSVNDGVLKIEDGGGVLGIVWIVEVVVEVVRVVEMAELGRETVDGTLGIASGSLPTAFARTGSNHPPSYNTRSETTNVHSGGLSILYNSDTPNEAPQRQGGYRRDT